MNPAPLDKDKSLTCNLNPLGAFKSLASSEKLD